MSNVVAEWAHIDTLTPWDKNPRDNRAAIPKVAASIKRYGFPTVVTVWDESGIVLAGHTRVAAMRSLLSSDPDFLLSGSPGPGFVPVRRCSFASEAEAQMFALADNKLGEEARWDSPLLADLLADLSTSCGLDALGVSGFNSADVLAALDLKAAATAADRALAPPDVDGSAAPPPAATQAPGASAIPGTPTTPTPAQPPATMPRVAQPVLTLVGILLPRAERDTLLSLAYAVCEAQGNEARPASWEAMAESPLLGTTIVHALRVACGKVGHPHE